jgi:hypothetical protein
VINAVSDMLVSIVDSVRYVIGGNQGNAWRVENVLAVFPHHLARLRSGHVSTHVQNTTRAPSDVLLRS